MLKELFKTLTSFSSRTTQRREEVRSLAAQVAGRYNWEVVDADTASAPTLIRTPFIAVDGVPVVYFADAQKKSGISNVRALCIMLSKQIEKLTDPKDLIVNYYLE